MKKFIQKINKAIKRIEEEFIDENRSLIFQKIFLKLKNNVRNKSGFHDE